MRAGVVVAEAVKAEGKVVRSKVEGVADRKKGRAGGAREKG